MRFIIRRPHIARSIAIFLAWGAMLGIIVNPWMDGYHGIGGSLWGVSGYVSALVSAFAFLSHRERKDTANSVIAVSSRRAILARYFIADMLTLNIIPFMAVAAATMIGSSVLAGRGYIVWEYFFLIPVFLTLAIFIGWICAHLFMHIPLGLLTSGLLTLFISFYAIQSNTETNAWIQFNNKAFGVLSILILSAVAGFAFVWRFSPRRLAHAAGWVALTTMAGFVWFAGYVDLTIKPRTADITPACTDIDPDIICIWPEDSYKLPILAEQATRIRSLASNAGIDAEPIAFSEPNIPAIF